MSIIHKLVIEDNVLVRCEEIDDGREPAGNEDLDASLAAFEEGISLVRFCTEKLESAEQKVKILLTDADGVREAPFEEKGGDTL